MTQDRMTTLADMRPRTSLADLGTAQEQIALRERIMADRSGDASVVASRPRRLIAGAGVLAIGVLATPGVAAAVGNGMRPQSFVDAYAGVWFGENRGVDESTVRRAGSAPGPDGGSFTVITARNDAGQTCITPLFETRASARSKAPDDFEGGFSFCRSESSTASFGINGVEYIETAAIWDANAGAAVSAEVRMPTGETYAAVLVEGYFFGWHPLVDAATSGRPTLTGYAADGSVVGEVPI